MDIALLLDIVIYCLLGVTVLSLIRVVIGPEPEDRMVGLNLTASQVLAILVLAALRLDQAIFLDVALVYAILGFVGMLAIARSVRSGEESS
jgi:multisubunit Na+/H+ antiporter MnhF subunit